MTVERMDAAAAEKLGSLFTGIDWNGKEKEQYLYYAACEGNVPVGALALDPDQTNPKLLSVGVTPEHTGEGIGKQMICHVMQEIAEPDLFIEATIPASREDLASFLTSCGMKPVTEELLVSVSLRELLEKDALQSSRRAKDSHFVPLKALSNREFHSVISEFSKKQYLADLVREELDEELSLFLMKDQQCRLCILFFAPAGGTIRNAFVYSDGDKTDQTLLFDLFHEALELAEKRYPPETLVEIYGTNKHINGFLEDLFSPDQIAERFRVFLCPAQTVPAVSDAFQVIEESRLRCGGCAHSLGRVMECEIWAEKPEAVLDGGACAHFKSRD